MVALKELRRSKQLTQKEVADAIGVSLRSYVSYENDLEKQGTPKYRFFMQELEKMNLIDEEHGILSTEDIIKNCSEVFENYPVEYCYLFGSYAKGTAGETSDVDLLISTCATGFQYFGLVEELREKLHKKVDLLDTKQLLENEELLNEVLKEGVRIYGSTQKR